MVNAVAASRNFHRHLLLHLKSARLGTPAATATATATAGAEAAEDASSGSASLPLGEVAATPTNVRTSDVVGRVKDVVEGLLMKSGAKTWSATVEEHLSEGTRFRGDVYTDQERQFLAARASAEADDRLLALATRADGSTAVDLESLDALLTTAIPAVKVAHADAEDGDTAVAHSSDEAVDALIRLAESAQFTKLPRSKWQRVKLHGAQVAPPSDNTRVLFLYRNRHQSKQRQSMTKAIQRRLDSIDRLFNLRLKSRVTVEDVGSISTLPYAFLRSEIDRRISNMRTSLGSKLASWGSAVVPNMLLRLVSLPTRTRREPHHDIEAQEGVSEHVFEQVLVLYRASDGSILDIDLFEHVPCHLMPLFVPKHHLKIETSERVIIFGALFAGSLFPAYRSLNFALEYKWIAGTILASFLAAVSYSWYSSVNAKHTEIMLNISDTARNHHAASGRHVADVLLKDVRNIKVNHALMVYHVLESMHPSQRTVAQLQAQKNVVCADVLESDNGLSAADIQVALDVLRAAGLVSHQVRLFSEPATTHHVITLLEEGGRTVDGQATVGTGLEK